MLNKLTKLCTLDGVSGWEDEVRDWIREQITPYCESVTEDVMGNLIAFKKGTSPAAQKIMLCAHMDEVGLMITEITDDGYLKFGCVGGIDKRLLPGKRLRCGPSKVPGIIGAKPIHLTTPAEREKVTGIKELYIDIGADGKKAAEAKLSRGDVCAFDTVAEPFGDGLFKAKAIDDRVGCATLMTLIEGTIPCDCHFVFTVQEEVGLRGAYGAAYGLDPDIALIVEGTTGVDRPDMKNTARVSAPGEGVVLSYMDGSAIFDRELFLTLRQICEADEIPWQLKRLVAGGTDAGAIQRVRRGVRVAGIAASVRYIHAPASVASLRDMESLPRLALRFLENTGGHKA